MNIIPGEEWKNFVQGSKKKKSKTVKANKRKSERIRMRYSFEIYRDQAQEILKLVTDKKLNGMSSSNSAIIRDAIDEYLQKKK